MRVLLLVATRVGDFGEFVDRVRQRRIFAGFSGEGVGGEFRRGEFGRFYNAGFPQRRRGALSQLVQKRKRGRRVRGDAGEVCAGVFQALRRQTRGGEVPRGVGENNNGALRPLLRRIRQRDGDFIFGEAEIAPGVCQPEGRGGGVVRQRRMGSVSQVGQGGLPPPCATLAAQAAASAPAPIPRRAAIKSIRGR